MYKYTLFSYIKVKIKPESITLWFLISCSPTPTPTETTGARILGTSFMQSGSI